ncbi:hypothetical protein Nepgr_013128 [Nepenthes gracilis]|uniref:SET domain-containing protein n=1 Tax=Nepenthes gracilis TaxID=150966 RepID=A0AAD3SHI9_NEPGR|nr:hypothetical protein Nepgr_013128 [Nepenthes gracilis]
MDEELGSLESFLKWATQLGISDSSSSSSSSSCGLGHSLSVSYFPDAGGRGLAAARDLRKGELILRVPKSALMTKDSLLEKDRKLSDAIKRHHGLSSTQMLTICLLAEMGKGRRSFWYPYLMQLPRSYETLGSFGPFELKAFQVDDAIWIAEETVSKAVSQWRESIAVMEDIMLKTQLMTFKAWLWASATISSRTLHIPWDDAGCLCPMGDFFNYTAPGEDLYGFDDLESCGNASSFQVSSLENQDVKEDFILDEECYEGEGRLTDGGYEEILAAYCFYARKNYRKGEQVLLSYGTYTNLELLEHYGFLLSENQNDKVFIPLGPDIFVSGKWPANSLFIHQNGRPSFALLSALRLWFTPANQRKGLARLLYSGSQVSRQNEVAVMDWIMTNCCTILESLPSSIEEDILLLQAIAKVQDLQSSLGEVKKLPSSVANEFDNFMGSYYLHNGQAKSCRKVKRSIQKWKLAVQWRLRYKKILADCISFCTLTIQRLNCYNPSGDKAPKLSQQLESKVSK